MGRKNKYSKETKIKVINEYITGIKSLSDISKNIECSEKSVRNWVMMYKEYGADIFDNKPHNKSYTKEFKEKVVKEYLAGEGSLRDIQLKYKDGIMLTDYKPMSEVYTMKSRKVSYEERIEVVNYCITNNYDYKDTADKYNVPYSQVYTWVKKVKENGYESLKLQKKGPKPKYLVEPQTNEELLQLEIERLRREKERLELEVEVLKKKHRLQKRANIRK